MRAKMLLLKAPLSVHSRLSHILLTFIIVGLLYQIYSIAQEQRLSPLLKDADVIPEGNASPEELYLGRLSRELGLSPSTSWAAWRISANEQSEEWPSVTEVKTNFGAVKPKVINLETPQRLDLYAKKRMELPVPSSPPLGQVDASDFLFGISTTFARISDRDYAMIKAWARWLTDGQHHSNGASMVVVLDQAQAEQLDEVDRALQASGIDCWVTTTEEPMSMARRYFELTRILKTFAANLAANGQSKRWFGLVEDDVFFPSLSHLRDRLFTYNTDGQHYIGLPSERLDWDVEDGVIETYGGGAVLLTLGSLSRIPNLPCFETDRSNKASFRSNRWDQLLYRCLMKHTNLDMHVIPGFYSPNDDTLNEHIDSYETGLQPLLLRRYADRHLLNINKAHLVTNVCGESCFMQRYLFRDNWVLVNGISLTQYPDGVKIEHRDVHTGRSVDTEERDESTPKKSRKSISQRVTIDEEVGFADRARLSWSGRRNIWKLVDSAVSKDGAVWQAYVNKARSNDNGANSGGDENNDSVIVLIWERKK